MKQLNRPVTKPLQCATLLSTVILLTSCAATQTAIEHRTLDTKTSLSKTIFLDPVADSQKTIFVAVKNTSDQHIDVTNALKVALREHGYRVMNEPSGAHYLLQANILKVGKMSMAASQAALGGGYGSALAGGAAGAAIGALSEGSSNAVLTGGIAGGLVGLAADSLVKDVNYTMVTDVQISERVAHGKVKEQQHAMLANGMGSNLQQSVTRDSDYLRYRTRVVSNADRVNLSFEKARPALEQGLANTLAGIF